MEPEERQEVTQLLEFGEHTAAGRMTTEFIAVPAHSVVDDAIEALKGFEGGRRGDGDHLPDGRAPRSWSARCRS